MTGHYPLIISHHTDHDKLLMHPLSCCRLCTPVLQSQTCPCAAVSDMPLCCGLRHAPLVLSQTCPCAAVSDMPLCCSLRHAPVLRSQTCPFAAVSDMPLWCCRFLHALCVHDRQRSEAGLPAHAGDPAAVGAGWGQHAGPRLLRLCV